VTAGHRTIHVPGGLRSAVVFAFLGSTSWFFGDGVGWFAVSGTQATVATGHSVRLPSSRPKRTPE
jgi:hypothetical protein